MAVCKICGEKYQGDLKKCPNCATPFSSAANGITQYADKHEEFQADLETKVDRKKITYICSLCGLVNHIDKRRCSRCGKPRPRAEYIKALRILKRKTKRDENVFENNNEGFENSLVQEERANQNMPKQEEARSLDQRERFISEQERMFNERNRQLQNKEMVIYRYEDGPIQNRPITQPFVIVPYVSQHQPLYQYNPSQVYRFQPDTFLESVAKKETAELYCSGPKPTPVDLAILRAKKFEEIDELTRKIEELEALRKQEKKRKKRKTRRK